MTNLDGVDVNGENACSIVRKQCSQWTADNLRPVLISASANNLSDADVLPINHRDRLAVCTITVREDFVVYPNML